AVIAAMRTLFEAWGAHVDTGSTAAEALAAMRRIDDAPGIGMPDLIVADLRLADDACGVEAVAALHATTGRRAPALIVSGDTSDNARDAVAAAGYVLLAKPVVATTLCAAAVQAMAVRPPEIKTASRGVV